MDKVDFDDHAENYNELLREGVGFFSPDEAYFARYKVDLVRDATKVSVQPSHLDGSADQLRSLISPLVTPSS